MKFNKLLLPSVLSLIAACSNIGDKQAQHSPGLTVSDGVLCMHGKPYRGMGVNYFSLFYRRLKNPSDLSYREGLEKLSKAGIPFVRFMACGFWPVDWELYQSDKDAYFKLLDEVVRCAEENNIGLIPSLFWNMATVPDVVGEPMDQLGNPESRTSAFIRNYTTAIVSRYKNSPAIWAWEFGNEYNLHVDLPNADTHRPPVWPKLRTAATRSGHDDLKAEMMLVAFNTFAESVRKIDSGRLLITGNSIPRPHAWHNSNENSWQDDSADQLAEMLKRDNPDPFGLVCVHVYPRKNCKYPGLCKGIPELVDLLHDVSLKTGKPLFIGEFGAALTLGPEEEKIRFNELVDAIVSSSVSLSAMWVFDLPGQDKDWNVTFENKRAYMLKSVVEANERLKSLPE